MLSTALKAGADPSVSVVLLTLDTTRADYIGAYGNAVAETPVLDALAARGTRYARALSPSPLTLPAHASLLTGLDPPEHGARDNGTSTLAADIPTLATVLRSRGYATAAFVASRVLDRRFGLDRGFDLYDDVMAAEKVGEYGYPERDAEAVTDAAIRWLEAPPPQPYLLWVHYYDPHAPYAPPTGGGSDGDRYVGEIAYMDAQIGRLLAALPGDEKRRLVAVAGDHGEALGEHGERAHGIFLYRAVLEVPLILAGPGVPAGRVVQQTVPSRRLAPTLLRLLEIEEGLPPQILPGLGLGAGAADGLSVYHETLMPATAYGWSSLEAVSDDRWRLIVAPRPELYDFVTDPGETRNLVSERRAEARRMRDLLVRHHSGYEVRETPGPGADPELAESLRSLGYLSGASAGGDGDIDPKDGIAMLAELEAAKALVRGGRYAEAVPRLADLTARSPGNVPLLTHYAGALLAAGRHDEAIATYRRAVALNPGLDFLHLQLANAYSHLRRVEDARREYELVLEINPRFAAAWLALAEMAHRGGRSEEERWLLRQAVAAGTASGALLLRLGQVEMAAGRPAVAIGHLQRANELLPGWALGWWVRGQLELEGGEVEAARRALRRAVELAPDGPVGRQARQLLGELPPLRVDPTSAEESGG